MKRYYYVALLALVMVLGMQTLYIESLYKGYRNARIAAVSDSLSIAVDNEFHYRNSIAGGKQPEKRHTLQYKFAEDMTPAELDSLKRIKTDTIVLDAARNSRIGQTSADIIAQLRQDMALRAGHPLQLSTLDSIFGGMMKGAAAYRLSLLDKEKEVIATAGTLEGRLLELLLAHRSEVVGRDHIVDELWREGATSTTAQSLNNLVSRLRKCLEEDKTVQLETVSGKGYRMNIPSHESE